MNDKEETDAIRRIADLEWACHRKDKEYSQIYNKSNKIKKKFPVPQNKLLNELLNRLEDLKVQRRKILSDIKVERLNEYRRKVSFRRSIPEIVEVRKELKIKQEERNKLFKELNELGEKYGSKIFNAGWDLYQLEKKEKSND